jgi:FtsP/CotA-like multicopper oxidase with cupredoxin domain
MFENRLPITEFDLFKASSDPQNPSEIYIKIQSRLAKLSDNPFKQPTQPNCWRYIRKHSKEDGKPHHKVLDVFIGPVLNVRRGVPLTIHFSNTLGSMPMLPNSPMLESPPINPPPMVLMQDMNPSVGVAVHLHGGKVQSHLDGWPLQPMSFAGNPYGFHTTVTYTYPNQQRAAMLWFHDHGMDNTAPQVHAGLAGLYFIRDESDDQLFNLLEGALLDVEIPLVIQDRVLNCDANGFDYWAGLPTQNPQYDLETGQLTSLSYLRPEFLGDTIFVNGRAWPHHDVSQRRYRLRILNGSNARTYALALVNPEYWTGQGCSDNQKIWYSDKLTVIGNDGGLFATKKSLNADDYLVLSPGERLDLIMDLTDVCPDQVAKLRLVNLAVGSLARGECPEGIFQHEDPDPIKNGSILKPTGAPDKVSLTTLLAIKQANIMQFCISHHADEHGHGQGECNCQANAAASAAAKLQFMDALDQVLLDYANSELGQEGFQLNGNHLQPINNAEIAANRLVVLMNNPQGLANLNPYTIEGKWHDTQIWEMGPVQSGSSLTPFQIPFDAQLGGLMPGNPAALTDYQVLRSTFLDPATQTEVISKANTVGGFNLAYPAVAPATIKPTAGNYERWYVANLGNWQSADDMPTKRPLQIPDMHPFHIHLVNFVVLRRFALNDNGDFTGIPKGQNTFDSAVRHDTVRINSNELVELLVYFPPGYSGKYPYHCHLVEHEDMGMMLHFEV